MKWVVALIAAVVLVGCQGQEQQPAVKWGPEEVRTDLDPLITRFPVLGAPSAARWMSGAFGRADVPGPSTYWIDAVVTLSAADVERVRAAYAPTDQGKSPDVVEGMRGRLPDGPFLTGEALDAAFAHERWYASAYLDLKSGELVLVATGT